MGEPILTSEDPADIEHRRILQTLRDSGIAISSLDELVNTSRPYPEAVPVLLRLLPTAREPNIREAIIRALTVKEARGIAAKPLVDEFRTSTENWVRKWTIGNALSVVADDSVFEDLVELAKDQRHGRAREMLMLALGRMKNPRAAAVLMELLDDDEVVGHAVIGLGNLRAEKARPLLERFLNHPMPWVRTEAKRALKKIETATAKRRGRRRV